MRLSLRALLLVPALTGTFAMPAQGFDPVKVASGWARQDIDGSFTFYDSGSQALQNWARDGGLMGSVSLAAFKGLPEFWAMDTRGNAWVVAGTTLYHVDKDGKVGDSEKLPGEVTDLAWDAQALYLSFRGEDFYVEKRDINTGRYLWAHGNKPRKEKDGSRRPAVYRITVTEANQVLLTDPGTLTLTVLDGAKGKPVGQMVFAYNGGMPPALNPGRDREPLRRVASNQPFVYTAIPPSQAPAALKATGMVLVRMDTAQGTLDLIPTTVSEGNLLAGVTDTEATFVSPAGGLTFVPVH